MKNGFDGGQEMSGSPSALGSDASQHASWRKNFLGDGPHPNQQK